MSMIRGDQAAFGAVGPTDPLINFRNAGGVKRAKLILKPAKLAPSIC
jgi:hypothetical protein